MGDSVVVEGTVLEEIAVGWIKVVIFGGGIVVGAAMNKEKIWLGVRLEPDYSAADGMYLPQIVRKSSQQPRKVSQSGSQ